MSDDRVKSDLINVKYVTEDNKQGKNKDQDKVMFCIGTDKKTGANDFDKLLDILEQYRGKQVNFDFRISTKEMENGKSFRSAFLLVKEMVPKSGGSSSPAKKDDVKKKASEIRAKFGK